MAEIEEIDFNIYNFDNNFTDDEGWTLVVNKKKLRKIHRKPNQFFNTIIKELKELDENKNSFKKSELTSEEIEQKREDYKNKKKALLNRKKMYKEILDNMTDRSSMKKVLENYTNNTWQYRLINNKYQFKTGGSVLERYNLGYLEDKYRSAKSNTRKNVLYDKLLNYISPEEWETIVLDVEYIE